MLGVVVHMSAVHAEPLTLQLDAARQFDFWLGEWDCSWEDGDRRHVGTNSVYLDLGGKVGFENGVMELRRNGEVDGAPAVFRMRWENIERESLDWSWQRSDDGGETWVSLWEIEYSRVL